MGRLQWLYPAYRTRDKHAVGTDDRAAVFTEFRVFGARAAVWAKKLTVRNICTAIFADHKNLLCIFEYLSTEIITRILTFRNVFHRFF